MGTMQSWEIRNTKSGLILGRFAGRTEAEALDALARDAGYPSYREMAEVAPVAPGELRLIEVAPLDGWHNLRAGGSAVFADGEAVQVSNRPCDGEGSFDSAFPRVTPLWERLVFCELCARTGRAYRWAEGSSWDAAEGEDEAVRAVEAVEDEPEIAECAYCGRGTAVSSVPAADDDGAWAALAADHAPDCEWIATRAHRREAR